MHNSGLATNLSRSHDRFAHPLGQILTLEVPTLNQEMEKHIKEHYHEVKNLENTNWYG